MIRIAVVGLGFIGKVHLGAYNSIPEAEVVAICDIRPGQLNLENAPPVGNLDVAAVESRFLGASKFGDLDSLFEAGGFDAVDICLPTFLHAEYTVRSLDAGYHVFCEKPMALDSRETKSMLDAVARTATGSASGSERILQIGHCLRFWPAYVELKKMIDNRTFGEVRSASFTRLASRPNWTWGDWILDPGKSGSAALDLHVHDVDMVRWLFGEPTAISSHGLIENGGVGHVVSEYSFENDILVRAEGGWMCSDGFPFRMQALVMTDRGTIELDSMKENMLTVYEGGEERSIDLNPADGFRAELEAFVGAVASNTPVGELTPEDSAKSVSLCLREIEAVMQNR